MFNAYELEKRLHQKGKKDLVNQNHERWKDKAKSRSYMLRLPILIARNAEMAANYR